MAFKSNILMAQKAKIFLLHFSSHSSIYHSRDHTCFRRQPIPSPRPHEVPPPVTVRRPWCRHRTDRLCWSLTPHPHTTFTLSPICHTSRMSPDIGIPSNHHTTKHHRPHQGNDRRLSHRHLPHPEDIPVRIIRFVQLLININRNLKECPEEFFDVILWVGVNPQIIYFQRSISKRIL